MSTANGVGTKYYGKADRRGDGSYVATKWLVFFYVPLLPMGSARLHDVQRSSAMRGTVRTSSMTFRAEAVRLHWTQVLLTYGCAAVLVPLVWLAGAYVSTH